MKMISIRNELEELEDTELHRRLSIVNLRIRKNKEKMKNDEEVQRAEAYLHRMKNSYKIESMKLKTLGEQLIKELALRKYDDIFFLEKEE